MNNLTKFLKKSNEGFYKTKIYIYFTRTHLLHLLVLIAASQATFVYHCIQTPSRLTAYCLDFVQIFKITPYKH